MWSIQIRKRILVIMHFSTRIYIVLIGLCIPLSVFSNDDIYVVYNSLNYAITENYTATVVQQYNLPDTIIIPDTIHVDGGDFPVTCIEKNAFSSCSNLKNIVIPSTVEIVYSSAFEGTAFYNNRNNWDSNGCLYIDDILIRVLPKKIKKEFQIPNHTRVFASGTFEDCSKLRKLILPYGITVIPPEAFCKCVSLETINLPSSIYSIGRDAFHATRIYSKSENWEDGILYVDKCAVESNDKVARMLSIRQDTRLLANGLLRMNRRVNHVILPNSVTHIGEQAFSNCNSLIDIDCGGNLIFVGNQAFLGCCKLRKVANIQSTQEYSAGNNTEYSNTEKQSTLYMGAAVFYNCHSLSTIQLPENLACIHEYFFYNCISLCDVILPKSLLIIGNGAFAGCTNLEQIVIPSSVKNIGIGCFHRCEKLRRIDMSACSRISTIPAFFAKRCINLRTVLFPYAIESIDSEAFAFDEQLKECIYNERAFVAPDAFEGCNNMAQPDINISK